MKDREIIDLVFNESSYGMRRALAIELKGLSKEELLDRVEMYGLELDADEDLMSEEELVELILNHLEEIE